MGIDIDNLVESLDKDTLLMLKDQIELRKNNLFDANDEEKLDEYLDRYADNFKTK